MNTLYYYDPDTEEMLPAQAPWIRRCPDADGDCTNEQTAAELNRATARAIVAEMQTASDLYALAEAGLRIDMQNVFYHREPDAIKVSPAPAKRLNYTTWFLVILLVVLWAMAAIWILAGGTTHA